MKNITSGYNPLPQSVLTVGIGGQDDGGVVVYATG
jgi:hypothetical protein